MVGKVFCTVCWLSSYFFRDPEETRLQLEGVIRP